MSEWLPAWARFVCSQDTVPEGCPWQDLRGRDSIEFLGSWAHGLHGFRA